MLIKMLTKVFGSRNDRTLRRMRKVVNIINGTWNRRWKNSLMTSWKAKTAGIPRALGKRRNAGKPDP